MPAHASSTVYEVSFATQEEIGTVKYNNEDYKLLRVKISSQYTEFLMKEKTGKIGTADFPQAAYTIDFSSVNSNPGNYFALGVGGGPLTVNVRRIRRRF